MKNSSIVKAILDITEKEHLNLYHSITKETILSHIKSISWDNLTPLQFDLEMLKIFSKFKDAHTSYFIPTINTNKKFILNNNEIYLKNKEKYEKIVKIGNIDSETIINLCKNITTWETEAWANCQIEKMLNNMYFHSLIGVNQNKKIKCQTENREEIVVKENTEKVHSEPYYSYKILDGTVLYLKYRGCLDMKDYPFAQMVKEIEEEIKNHKIENYILDVRGNTGGSSEVLNPFQELVADKKLKGVLLIDNWTFSAGRFAVARFKKHFNTPLIGQPTGGSAKSYGQKKRLEFEGKKFSASQKFFDFSDLGYTDSFIPDIEVKTTIQDLEKGEDKILETALNYIKTNLLQKKENELNK